MKLSNLLWMSVVSLLAFTGCKSNDDNSEWAGNQGIVFSSRIEGLTRASGSAWSANDQVGIFMTETGKGIASATDKNKKYLAQADGTLNAASGNAIYFPAEGNVDFVAYYPYSESLSGTTYNIDVTDQSKPEAIDLLYSANATNVAKSATVGLTFSHQLSQIVLNLTNDGTLSTLKGLKVTLSGTNTTAAFNLADGKLTASDSKKDIALNVNADATQATAIVLPATTDALSGAKLTFTLDGVKPFEASLPAETVYEAGTKYTYNVKLSLNNGKIVVNMGKAEITDWTEKPGGDINVDFEEGEQPTTAIVVTDDTPYTALTDGQGDFTIDDKVIPEGGTYVWIWDSKYNYMKASGYVNKENKAAESRLISPAIDLSKVTAATLTFSHKLAYKATPETDNTLWVAEAGTDTWEQLTIDTYSATNWAEVNTSIDLAKYIGKTVKFAFKYLSTADAASTWEVYNFKVASKNSTPEPEPTPTPSGDELYISEYVEGSGQTKYLEIYNPTDTEIDLSKYVLNCASNGKTWADEKSYTYQPLEGTIAAKAVIVYKNSQATAYTGEAIDCKACGFNGEKNDAVGLFKDGTLIDVFGYPADPSADPNFGKDVTYRRKTTVTGPSATFDLSQWDEAAKDDVSGLGKR